jgi:hypothetical protein
MHIAAEKGYTLINFLASHQHTATCQAKNVNHWWHLKYKKFHIIIF